MADFPTDLSGVEDNVDDVLAKHVNNLETKVGVDDSAVVTSLDYMFRKGWSPANETWVYVSATSFKVEGVDVTSKYPKGTRIRYKQGGAYEYGVVISSAFSTDTTVTLATNTDYALANDTITDNGYSYMANPVGYPQYFNYTPTFDVDTIDDASGGQPTITTARFGVIGKTCYGYINANGKKVTANARIGFTPPIVFSSEIDNYTALGAGFDQYAEKVGVIIRLSTNFRIYWNDTIADDTPVYAEGSWNYEI